MTNDSDGLGSLARSASAAFIARVLGAGLMLLVQLAVVRRLGADAGGYMAAALAVSGALAAIGRLGADQLVVRRVSVGTLDDARLQRGIAIASTLPLLLILGAGLFVIAAPLSEVLFQSAEGAIGFRWFAISLPAFGIVALQGEALKAIGRPGAGATVQSLVGPATSATLLMVTPSTSLGAMSALLAVGYVIASLSAEALWRLHVRQPGLRTVDKADRHAFRQESLPFLSATTLSVALLYGPVLALSVAGSAAEVSAYFAADRWTQLPAMTLVAVNAVVGPRFATLWATNQRRRLRELLRRSTAATFALSAAMTAFLVAAAPVLLSAFGESFDAAVPAMRFLAIGQFVVLASGPVTSVLLMTGGERSYRRATAISLVVMSAALVALVPTLGSSGAAIASAVAAIAGKAIVAIAARSRIDSAVPGTPSSTV